MVLLSWGLGGMTPASCDEDSTSRQVVSEEVEVAAEGLMEGGGVV